MLSAVALCNAALAKIGDAQIIDLNDESKQARACNEAFVRVRDALLGGYRWSFAMTRAQLAASATAPAFEYSLQYPLPVDLLRLDYVGDMFVGLDLSDYRNASTSEFKVEGRVLLTDMPAPLNIRYIKRVTDTTIFDPLFDEAFACKLAGEITTTLTQSDSMKEAMGREFAAVLRLAIRTNAVQRAPEALTDETWLLARL